MYRISNAPDKNALRKIIAVTLGVALLLALVSCGMQDSETKNEESPSHGGEISLQPAESQKRGGVIGDYKYPRKPAEELRNALQSDAESRGLPVSLGDVEKIEFDGKEYAQIKIGFTDGSENVCIISFTNKHLEYGYEEKIDGNDNPSFTMAFKNPDNSQDMVMLLECVIRYLSPDLNPSEAERLATNQNGTIGTDGYSMPVDLGGYQIQAQYTNPNLFVRTPDFDSNFGVRVRALKQIWKGSIDTRNCVEMSTPEDFKHLTTHYNSWDADKHPDIVYADFIVKNMWQGLSRLHGETWVVVDVESMTGEQYSITLDTWEFPNPYEFGVGQQYTLFIGLNYVSGVSGGIMYAVQKTESTHHNSRGEVRPIDYPIDDWQNPKWRVEPEGEGTVYDVYYCLQSQTWGETYAVLEGQGLGEEQWLPGAEYDGFTFLGWYDNTDYDGDPYTKDTPIYQDTRLYAKWKYSGAGGAWPRALHGDIQGIDESGGLTVEQKLSITASGYNMNLETPNDQRFRWLPVAWRLSSGGSGRFSSEFPYRADIQLGNQSEERLYITYTEEVFDGYHWQGTGQVREVEEALLNTGS